MKIPLRHNGWKRDKHFAAKVRRWYVPASDGRTYYYNQAISDVTLQHVKSLGTAKEMLREMRQQAEYAMALNLEDHGVTVAA